MGRGPKTSRARADAAADRDSLDPALALLARWQAARRGANGLPGQAAYPLPSGPFYGDDPLESALEAVRREFAIVEELRFTPALTLAGVAAKLEVVVLALEIDGRSDFPRVHLRVVLEELRRLAG